MIRLKLSPPFTGSRKVVTFFRMAWTMRPCRTASAMEAKSSSMLRVERHHRLRRKADLQIRAQLARHRQERPSIGSPSTCQGQRPLGNGRADQAHHGHEAVRERHATHDGGIGQQDHRHGQRKDRQDTGGPSDACPPRCSDARRRSVPKRGGQHVAQRLRRLFDAALLHEADHRIEDHHGQNDATIDSMARQRGDQGRPNQPRISRLSNCRSSPIRTDGARGAGRRFNQPRRRMRIGQPAAAAIMGLQHRLHGGGPWRRIARHRDLVTVRYSRHRPSDSCR